MRRRSRRLIAAAPWVAASILLLTAAAWFTHAFSVSRDLGISRLLYGWHDPRFAAFHRLFFALKVGMSRAELEATIRRIYPQNGERKPPRFWIDEPTNILLFMDPEVHVEPNCEGISLQISNGRIVAKGYSMD